MDAPEDGQAILLVLDTISGGARIANQKKRSVTRQHVVPLPSRKGGYIIQNCSTLLAFGHLVYLKRYRLVSALPQVRSFEPRSDSYCRED